MKILSLCSGYGGLDMAVEQHFSAKTAYWSDIDKTACDVMTARFPDAQPIGDLTTLDLTMIDAEVLCAGYPCQPFSLASSKRKGTADERHLWPYIRNTISVLRPRFVVLENVAGHLSMGAAAVVGDLASLDYDTRAGTVRASSIGAPHQRKRWFCVATDTDSVTTGGDTGTLFREKESRRGEPNQGNRSPHGDSTTGGNDAVTDAERGFEQGESGSAPRLAWQSGRSAREAVTDANGEGLEGFGGQHKLREASEEEPFSWGRYDRAVRRWERVLGRPAPVPVVDNRVSAVFVEWMMGLEEGHVTDIAASRAKALACLGNGVVPQQAKRALELLT